MTMYSIQKDNFSHANLTIPNTDVHVVLDNKEIQMHPRHKVAIFRDRLEPMWDFTPHYLEVHDDAPEDALVTTGQMIEIPNLIQQNGYPTLTTEQALVSNRMVTPFSIQPCETLNQEGNKINSFMYRGESISSAYEAAGYAFMTEHYCQAPEIPVHFQGFEVLRRFHFPPSMHNKTLWNSLHPNLMAEDFEENLLIHAPTQKIWNSGFDNFFRTGFHGHLHTNPFFLQQLRLQKLIKAASLDVELDAIYDVAAGRSRKRVRRQAAEKGEKHRRIRKMCSYLG